MTVPAHGRLEQLTGLRFVAAFAVMLSHLTFLAESRTGGWAEAYRLLFSQGYCGVSFFFILSGFVMGHSYADRLRRGEVGIGRYLWRRAARILPLHWAVTIAFVAWLAVADHQPPLAGTVALNLALLHAWASDPAVHYSLNGPSWSLSVELFFYLAFPLLILVPARLLAGVLGLGLIGLVVAAARLGDAPYTSGVEWVFYVHPLVRLAEFAAGVLIHAAWANGRLRMPAGTMAEAACLVLIPAAMLAYVALAVPMPLRAQLAYMPVMALVVAVFVPGRGALSHWLASPPLRLLGEASFALYLTHRPVMTFAAQRWGERGGAPLAAALLVLCCLLAILVHLTFERPVMALARRLERARDGGRSGLDPALGRG